MGNEGSGSGSPTGPRACGFRSMPIMGTAAQPEVPLARRTPRGRGAAAGRVERAAVQEDRGQPPQLVRGSGPACAQAAPGPALRVRRVAQGAGQTSRSSTRSTASPTRWAGAMSTSGSRPAPSRSSTTPRGRLPSRAPPRPGPGSSSWTTGGSPRSRDRDATTSSRSSTTATPGAARCWPAKSPSSTGTRSSATPPSATPSSTDWSTTLTVSTSGAPR